MKYDFSPKGTRVVGAHRRQLSRLPMAVHALIIVGIFCIGCIASVFFLWLLFLRGASSAISSSETFVIVSTKKSDPRSGLAIVHMDKQKGTTVILPVPDNLLFSSKEYGSFPAFAAYGLFALDGKSTNAFAGFLSRMMAIPIRGAVVTTRPLPTDQRSLAGVLVDMWMMPAGHSSLSRKEAFGLWAYLRSNTGVFTVQNIPERYLSPSENNLLLLSLDRATYDPWIENQFADETIRSEGLSVSVINSSGLPRAATMVARFLANIGYTVITVNDTEQLQQRGKVILARQELASSRSIALLDWYFDIEPEVNQTIAAQYRADIVIFLGTEDVRALSL